ncbi:hypothetical protein [Desulforhopalus singaporensis]|uniref:Uncharacterized protein n=1 Tax=Desulforhopalus singaporensis TaxID=91360 RepID=A0A1H0W557_9BACT|nr:hypothetical protein [Desulforhopalus singaporensis]SDP85723.1 hypothetical protein SAMN05660330_04417 [Desulforhopalus singaporensis]
MIQYNFLKYLRKIVITFSLFLIYSISGLLIYYAAGEEPFCNFRKFDAFLLLILASYCQSALFYCLFLAIKNALLKKTNFFMLALNVVHALIAVIIIYMLADGQYYYIDDIFKYSIY